MEEHDESEDDQYFFSHAPRMPEDDIIMSEVAILTGGRDQYGRPIITFPAKYHGILESKVKASGMDVLLRYYIDITRPKDRQRGFAFVTDLRFSVLDFIIFIKSTLNSLQAEMNGAIGTCVFYVILPLNKKTHKDTMTHLSLRESKKKINKNIVPPFFQSIGVDDEMELYNYIEKSHLTTELGGYLQYSHQDWVVFRRVVEPFFSAFETFQAKLSHAFHRLTTMMNINGGNTKGELQQTLNIVQDEYKDIRRELNLDPVMDKCEELLRRFTCCEEEDVFTFLAQKPVFKETKDAVDSCYRVLTSAKKKIEDDWNELSGGIVQAMQHVDYTTNVNKLLEWFKFKKERDLKQHGVIAEKLSDAELMYNHFETGLLPKAKEKLGKANDLVLLGERMTVDFNNRRVSDIVTLNQILKDETEEFQTLVKKRHQLLQSVYHFHQLYYKARRWYIKCLRFLPPDLSDLYNELRSHSQDDHLGASQLQWEEDVRRFLHKSPLPAKEELKKVKMIPEQIGDVGLKKKGRLLTYRCSILTIFLSHKKNKTTSANIVDMLKWQSELLNQADDSASCQSEALPFSDQIRRAQSESSLDSAGLSQKPRKVSSKKQSKTASKNHKTKLDKDEPLHQSTQTLSRSKRDKRRDDRHSDANGYSMGVSDTDDPLIRRLGKAGDVYHRHGDRQGQGHDDIDHSEAKAQKTQRNKQISGTRKRELPSIKQQLQQAQLVRSQSVPHNNPSSSQQEHSQSYGIYGDVDVEDDTAVVIKVPLHSSQNLPMSPGIAHQQVPSYPSRSLPVSPGVAQQQGPSYPTQTPPVDSSSAILYHQLPPHPLQGPYVDVSSSGNQHHRLSHPPQDIPVARVPGNYLPHQQISPMSTWNPGGQHVPLTMDPSNITLGSNQLSYGVVQQVVTPSNHYNRTQPSNNTTSNRQHGPSIQHEFPNENYNITASPNFNSSNSYTQSPTGISSLTVQNVNDAKQRPISFHGSLMNVHQPPGMSPVIGQNFETHHVIGNSPVTRHQSLMNLSPSPRFDGGNPQYIRMQDTTWQPDSSHSTQTPQNNGPFLSTSSSLHTGLPNSRRNTLPNLRHGFSEPNLSSLGYEQPPTYDIPSHHGNLKSRLPHHYGYSNHGTLSSRHPLSQSETDLRHVPGNVSQFGSLSHGLSHSNQSLHRSDPELGHVSPTRNASVHLPNRNVGYSPTWFPSASGEDPQLEYYKKLYSSSPQLDQTTSASGRRSTNHTLDPAVHTWMHDVPSTITESFLESRPVGRRLMSPLKLLELEVANETLDAEDAILEDDYEKQQLRRYAVIDSIIGRSDLGIRPKNERVSTQSTPRLRHVYDQGQGSVSIPRKRQDSVMSPLRKAERNLFMSPVSANRRERHPDLYHDTPSSKQIPRLYQSRQVHLPDTGRSYNLQRGSLVNENEWREQHLKDLGLASQEATPAIVNGSSHSPSHLVNRTERDFGLSSTLPQFSSHQQSPRSFPTSYNETNQRLNDLIELGIIPPDDFMDLEMSHFSPYPSNPSWHPQNINTQSMEQNPGQDYENNWRLQHLRELGLSPHQANSTVVESAYPESMYQSSSSSPNWRYQDRQELGLTHGAAQKRDSAVSHANGGNHRSHYMDDVHISPTNHHPAVNQSSISAGTLPLNRSVASDTNWRQNHMQEPVPSPRYDDSYRSNNVHVPLRKPAKRISGADEQRHPQPTNAGPSHSRNHSERNNIQAHGSPQNWVLGIHSQSNRRQDNLQDAGISLRQRANLSEPFDTYHNGLAQRSQQQTQTHISPSAHHVSSQQNAVLERRVPIVGQGESDPNWRSNHLRELGISPTMQQYANQTQQDLADVAPVTRRLQGVIASGRSPSNMEEFHQLDEDTRKKSVRFARGADESSVDEEEKAQDEEVALRLRQLELKLQEEEQMLMRDEVTRAQQMGRPHTEARDVGPHQPTAHHQHQRNSNQPGMQKQVSNEQPGYVGLTERAVQQPLNQNTRRKDVDKPSYSSMQSGNSTSSFNKPSSIASKSGIQNGQPDPIRTQEGSLGTQKTVTPDKNNLKSYSRPPYGAMTAESQDAINIRQTDRAANHEVKRSGLQNQSTGSNVEGLDYRQSQGTSREHNHHIFPVNEAQFTNRDSEDERNALPKVVKPRAVNYVDTISDRADRDTSHETILPSARLQNYNLNTNHRSLGPSNSLQTVDKSKGTRSEVLSNERSMHLQTATLPVSAAASDETFADQEKSTLPSQKRTPEPASKVRPFNRQVSLGGRDHSQQETTERKQKPPDVDMEPENQVLNGSQSMYKPSERSGVPRNNEDHIRSELYQTDRIIPSGPQLERDHTAADYIACALGLDYVSDKTDLTVQPRINSSDQLNSSDQDYEYSNESLLGDRPPRRAQQNPGQLLDSSHNGNGRYALSNQSDAQGSNISTKSSKVPHVSLPGSRDGLEEGPCSPIRQWLKEKEINEGKEIPQNKLRDDSKPGYIASPTDNQTDEVGEASVHQEALSPAVKSQSTSPIRQWLREKQNKEMKESTAMNLDHTGSGGFVVDASTGKISELKANKFGYLGTRGTDSETSLLNQRGRSHSSSPSLLSTETSSKTKSGEQRRRSSSAIPVYKGLTKSSQHKSKEPSQRRMSDTFDMSPDASELMRKRAADSKKGNRYSKIPVPKVFKALQDGGFLGTETSKSEKGSPPLKQSNQSADYSIPVHKEQSRPVFERQGTFTKEERPPFNKEGTFTIESEDGNDEKRRQEVSPDAKTSSNATESSPKDASISPLGLVLDHIVRKGNVSKSKKAKSQAPDGKKRHDSQEEIFENSSTESSMSPTSKSTTTISRKPTSNMYNTKHYHINVHGGSTGIKNKAVGAETKDAGGDVGSYAGLAESDRLEHEDLAENDLEQMIAMKSQLAEIRNLEIENRHLAYERKEFEAHYLKNMQEHQAEVETHSDEEG